LQFGLTELKLLLCIIIAFNSGIFKGRGHRFWQWVSVAVRRGQPQINRFADSCSLPFEANYEVSFKYCRNSFGSCHLTLPCFTSQQKCLPSGIAVVCADIEFEKTPWVGILGFPGR
jgi:hypothetical protein